MSVTPPIQAFVSFLALLGKKNGGNRTIAIMASVQRILSVVRRISRVPPHASAEEGDATESGPSSANDQGPLLHGDPDGASRGSVWDLSPPDCPACRPSSPLATGRVGGSDLPFQQGEGPYLPDDIRRMCPTALADVPAGSLLSRLSGPL